MNKYTVSGRVFFLETRECDCCYQIVDEDKEFHPSLEVEAIDEVEARDTGLKMARQLLIAQNPEAQISNVDWAERKKVKVTLISEVSEAELMRRSGAPMLEGFK